MKKFLTLALITIMALVCTACANVVCHAKRKKWETTG